MSKSSERRARKLSNQYESARLRFANGNATKRDLDMLARMQDEARGVNGYTGESRRSSSPGVTVTAKPNGQSSSSSLFHKGDSNPYSFRVTQPKDEHVFVCADSKEITDKCPLNPKVPYVLVPVLMWQTFLKLAKDINTEWIALLKGKLTSDDKGEPVYLIESYYHPPQTAGGAHVDIPTGVMPKPGTIGAIHSHVGMGVFFSGTDIAHSNWPVEIVINNKAEYKAVSRLQLKCGEYAKYDATVYTDGVMPKSKATEALETAFQQGSMLEQGRVKPHVPGQSTPPQGNGQVTPATVTDIVPATPTHGTGIIGDSPSSPANNPNNSRICVCGHSFGDHYRTPYAKENFPTGIAAGMCLEEICNCSMFKEKESSIIDLTKPLTELERQAIIDSDSREMEKDDPTVQLEFPIGLISEGDDTKAEETCEVCEGDKYVTEELHRHGAKVMVTRLCPACNGDGLSQLGKVRLAEMADSMNRRD
jgi:hypothetical protein